MIKKYQEKCENQSCWKSYTFITSVFPFLPWTKLEFWILFRLLEFSPWSFLKNIHTVIFCWCEWTIIRRYRLLQQWPQSREGSLFHSGLHIAIWIKGGKRNCCHSVCNESICTISWDGALNFKFESSVRLVYNEEHFSDSRSWMLEGCDQVSAEPRSPKLKCCRGEFKELKLKTCNFLTKEV